MFTAFFAVVLETISLAHANHPAPSLSIVVDQRGPVCPLRLEDAGGNVRCGDSQANFTYAEARSRAGAVLYRERRGLVRCSVVTLHLSSLETRSKLAGQLAYKTNCLTGERGTIDFEARLVDGHWRFIKGGQQAHCLKIVSSSLGVRAMEWDTRPECAS